MSTIRVVNIQHSDATEPNIVLEADGTTVFASGITISGGTNLTVSGTAEFASGTVSAPGITFIDDNNTGIYEPAADTVAITTAATERLRVDNSGNVAIGGTTITDSNLLNIQGSGATKNIGIVLNDTNTSKIFGIQNGGSSLKFFDYTASAERMRIDSSGNIKLTFPDGNNGLRNKIAFTTESPYQDETAYIAANRTATSFAPTDLIFATGTTAGVSEKMRIDSSGRLLVGTTTEGYEAYADNLTIADSGDCGMTIRSGTSNQGNIYFSDGTSGSDEYEGIIQYLHNDEAMAFGVNNGTERMRIDSSGNIGIGDTNPDRKLQVINSTDALMRLGRSDASSHGSTDVEIKFAKNYYSNAVFEAASHRFEIQGTEKVRIDSSGRVGIGTSSPGALLDVKGSNGRIYLRDGSANTAKIVALNAAGNGAAALIFETHNLETARIDSSGRVLVGTTLTTNYNQNASASQGTIIGSTGNIQLARVSDQMILLNRMLSDGRLQGFYGQGHLEGDITISGNTVSYNGAHLSRWSQLPGGAERIEILRGTVLSNLDEMCEWSYEAQEEVLWTEEDDLPEGVNVGDVKEPARAAGTENNEQLNRMKVSDVEGDRNVAGIFQAWDDDDDTYTNDFYCAMTGDFVIRIAQGTTVARGDLLMSAGDGTAKPQDDDIIRSKTIAKVTSTTVSTTYADGSFCVPCVLMAC
jgi:hypothetical protein